MYNASYVDHFTVFQQKKTHFEIELKYKINLLLLS